ncbi:MAG: response regulator [Bacteroidales bacterium]|nr:response regulator [Bacteroidales bacterium]
MKRRILLIDDDVIYRKIIQKLLCSQYNLFLAQDSKEAISFIENGDIPDLVIADLNMPGIEGAELIEIIRLKLNDKIPIIVISGMDHDYLKKELFQLGIFEFLLKPVDRIMLKERIAVLID